MKRILILILCGIMLLCFASCGNSEGSTNCDIEPTESTNPTDTNNQGTDIFNTKNIKRITFYAYYGDGKGSDVPAENLDEIIAWLDSFTIGEKAPELIPPGTNTHNIEIEYLDGTVVKRGLDTTGIDGITYYIKGDPRPECFYEIISKTSLY